MSKRRSRTPATDRAVHSLDLDRQRAREVRYYCPGCGMVRAVKSWGVTQVLTKVSPARVISHYRYVSDSMQAKVLCPGGEIDLVKDRAP